MELEERFRRAGLPLTVQRRAVYAALGPRRDHPTAEAIYEEVRGRVPGMSRTTVYRVLETLVGLGLARRACHSGAAARYDPVVERHDHAVCTVCGLVEDVEAEGRGEVEAPRKTASGFRIDDYSIYYQGVCGPCRRRK